MAVIVVLGTQWGDEGKGKVVHFMGKYSDYIVRYQCGNNAGHTIMLSDNQLYILHIVPSGILIPGKKCLIGNGVVLDPQVLQEEVRLLASKGIDVKGRMFISDCAHVILPYHKYLDKLHEQAKVRIGTTQRGIGPCYGDKVTRLGIRVTDYIDRGVFTELLERNLEEKGPVLKGIISAARLRRETMKDYPRLSAFVRQFVTNTSLMLDGAIKKNKNILFEGSQGTLLDLDFGTYPFVTSSNPVAGGACVGAGVGPTEIDLVLGVMKAYTTRVGEGPFPTEFRDGMGDYMRERGKEFGATTGRPRRCGWLDTVVVRHSVRVNGIKKLALTKIDCLSGLDKLKVCTAYSYKGKLIKEFPASREQQLKCTPVYETLPGFKEDIRKIKTYRALPENAKRYCRRIEQLTGADISFISLGRNHDETIMLDSRLPWAQK
jgi:adenylosuccinate synthase